MVRAKRSLSFSLLSGAQRNPGDADEGVGVVSRESEAKPALSSFNSQKINGALKPHTPFSKYIKTSKQSPVFYNPSLTFDKISARLELEQLKLNKTDFIQPSNDDQTTSLSQN